MHEAFYKYYTGTTNQEVIQFIIDEYKKLSATVSLQDQESIDIQKYTALGMWEFYPHKRLDEFEECFPEMEFEVTVGKLRGVRLVGRFDGLVKKDGKWWIREVKTTGLGMSQLMGRMQTSNQATTYVYGARKLGIDVQGVMFDCIRRPLLRKRQSERCIDFGKRIITVYKDDEKVLGDRKLYKRHFEYRNPTQLKHFEEDTMSVAKDIRRRNRENDWNRNLDQCWNYNALCPYSRICHMETPDKLTLDLFYKTRERN